MAIVLTVSLLGTPKTAHAYPDLFTFVMSTDGTPVLTKISEKEPDNAIDRFLQFAGFKPKKLAPQWSENHVALSFDLSGKLDYFKVTEHKRIDANTVEVTQWVVGTDIAGNVVEAYSVQRLFRDGELVSEKRLTPSTATGREQVVEKIAGAMETFAGQDPKNLYFQLTWSMLDTGIYRDGVVKRKIEEHPDKLSNYFLYYPGGEMYGYGNDNKARKAYMEKLNIAVPVLRNAPIIPLSVTYNERSKPVATWADLKQIKPRQAPALSAVSQDLAADKKRALDQQAGERQEAVPPAELDPIKRRR